jgi:hypothetical protein
MARKRLPPKLTITVSLEDILAGKRNIPGECPVALAARRIGAVCVVVQPWWIMFTKGGIAYQRVELPQCARKFVSRFDAEGHPAVAPITFDVGPLVPVNVRPKRVMPAREMKE